MQFHPQILLTFFVIIGNAAFGQIPITLPDFASTPEDAPTTIAVLSNDTDLLATIDPGTVDLDVSTGGIQGTITTTEGTFTADASGIVTFTPATNYFGPALLSYTVANDINVTSLPALITVTVTAVNDPPVAGDDGDITLEDNAVSVNVTDNDTDDGNIDNGSIDLDPAAGGQQTTVTTAAGTFNVNGSSGTVTFTPGLNYTDPATITYTVEDDQGLLSNVATLTVTITPVNDPPEAVADAASTSEDVPVTVKVTENDTDVDGSINAATVDLDVSTGGIQTIHTITQGTFISNGAGEVTFTPVANFNGAATIQYTVDDNGGETSDPTAITITVNAANDPPVAVADAITTNEGVPVTLNVVINDSDPEGSINAASVDLDINTAGIQNTFTTSEGTWGVNSTGMVTFTPVVTFNGDALLSYTVDDTGGATSNAAVITITVNAINDPPVAADDGVATGEELTVMVNVVANDTDEDGTVNPATVDLNTAVIGIQNTNSTDDGAYSVNSSGVVTFSPAANFSGVTTLPYTVNDNSGATSNEATITITVNAVNDPPEAHADGVGTSEEVPVTVNVVSNDTDSDGTIDAATVDLNTSLVGIQSTNTTAAGTFSVNASGVVTYTPETDFFGSATLPYTVNDNGGATSNAATISITVTPVNDPPVAQNDAAATDEETVVTVNVVTNDTDPDGTINANTVDLNTASPGIQGTITTAAGSFSVNSSGVVTYTPASNFSGAAVQTYTVNDNGGATSNEATITITVNAQNDPPVAGNDAISTSEDVVAVLDVTANDTDPDGTINDATVDLNTTTGGIQNSNSTAAGSFSVSASGTVTYTPALNFTGSAVLNYTVNDNDGATSSPATITFTVNPVNDAPVANPDAAAGAEGAVVTVNVVTNDTDVDGTINAAAVDLNTSVPGIQTTHATAAGTFTVNTSGLVTFTSLASFNGATSIQYTVLDNGGTESNEATITITINAINDAPVANEDGTSTAEDTPVSLNVVSNDTDEDGTINVATVDLNTSTGGIQATNTTAAGTFTVNASGVVTFTPVLNFTGPATLLYRVNDNEGLTSNAATITITVNAANDAPVAVNDALSANEDVVATVNVVANDTDVDGTINASTVDLNTTVGGIQNTAAISGGTVSVSASGVVTFTPTVNFYGIATTTYTVNDNAGATSDPATITFTVNAVNDPPIANNDITGADENETVSLNVVANDLDIDGTINAATVDLNPGVPGIQTSRTVSGGTFAANTSGQVTYTPTLNFNGIVSITYTVQDNAGSASNAATITVTVNSINSDPVAANDAVTTSEDVTASLNVVTNDSDADGTINAATVDLNTAVAGIQNSSTTSEGTFTVNATGMVTFTPAANFNGTASVTYTVNDNVGATSNAATITITVTSVNDLPIANNDATATNEGTAVTVNVIANDTDVDGTIDATTVDLNTTTSGIQNTNTTAAGAWTVTASGIVTLTPVGTFSGTATLSYKVNDNSGATSNAATISVTVNAVNDPPVAVNDAASANEDATATVNVVSNDTDEDGTVNAGTVDLNPATAGIQTTRSATEGTFSVSASGVVTFTPVANFNGSATTTYTVNDNGGLTSNEATITITINPVNDPPVAVNDAASTTEDVGVTFSVLANDTDVDGTINAAAVDLNTSLSGIQNTNTVAAGSFSVNAQGDVTFTPVANFSGTATVNYRVSDNNGSLSNIAAITVTINAVNDAPVFALIPNQRILQNSGQKTITITGISPGPSESEQLLLSVSSGNTSLIPQPSINYNGTATTATLTYTPVAGQSGVADITLKIVDTGLNEFSQTFQIEVLEVKIISQPVTLYQFVTPLPAYTYNIEITPNLPETLTISAAQKPAWLTLTSTGVNKARLQGTPAANAAHLNPIKIQVKSGSTVLDEQSYTLVVNHIPSVAPFSLTVNEDEPKAFAHQDFANAFTDTDGNTLSKIRIVTVPEGGTLRLNNTPVVNGQEISSAAIPNLTYLSAADLPGTDVFYWTGGDEFSFSTTVAAANITIAPVNDGPKITVLETDSLKYEVGSDVPRLMTSLFEAVDVDDEFLVGAQIGFRPQNYRPANDQLIFFNTGNITGVFDDQSGVLTLTGTATVAEYVQAIRSIHYNFINFSEIVRETKSVYITLSDGKTPGEIKDRYISLIYTFEELDIPNAFTPDGNGANDTWKIMAGIRGVEQYNEAIIRVYTSRGTLVYEAIGFNDPWNGMLNGEVLPADTYYYTIDLKYGKFMYKGIVTILR
jgi:gliding motility-associated-like protein